MVADIIMNDEFIGKCKNPERFLKLFKKNRRNGEISKNFNIKFDHCFNTIIIDSTQSRVRRALIIVENGKSKYTNEIKKMILSKKISFKDLIDKSIIEYIDALEEDDCLVCLNEKDLTIEHTHLEINPILILGLNTSTMPYCEFSDSSRLIRGQKTIKQAIGLYSTNFLIRKETDRNSLVHTQRPMVSTFTYDLFDFEKHPAGQNAIVALMSYEGYNMEDGIIMNQSSIERGFQRSFFYKIHGTEEIKYPGGLNDKIGLLTGDVKGFGLEEDYRFLEEDGIIGLNEFVTTGDIILGKISPPRFVEEIEGFGQMINMSVDSSISIKQDEKGTISSIFILENNKGNKEVDILIREFKMTEIGDKFASRHGQKGIIGSVFKQSDMPFTDTGLVPDIIISPHSVPGRKTVSHVMEILLGKVAGIRGEFIDATPFDNENEKDIRKELESAGFKSNGCETMFDPKTGKKFKTDIYVGSMYYLKLKHQVSNKLQARGTGPIQLLTRQPVEGKVRGGGLKLGEMEKDALISHGASLLLKERFSADQTKALISENKGHLVDPYFHNYESKYILDNSTRFEEVEISYVFKLLINHFKAMGIITTFKTKDRFTSEEGEKIK